MHYQINKEDNFKLVTCIKGRVLDVIVDIRPNSPCYNQPFSLELSEDNCLALLIGKGYAHGFLTLSEESWMLYATSSVHCKTMDRGILWSSIAFKWPNDSPIISERDSLHPVI